MRPRKRQGRRLVAVLGLLAGAPFLAGILLIAAVIFVGPVSRYALGRGLAAYNNIIPGRITVTGIAGNLNALRLRDVVLEDRRGRRIAEAGSLALSWSPGHLLFGELRVASLGLTDATLWVSDADGPTRFGDLAPPGNRKDEDEAAPRSPGLGPPIPLDVLGRVVVDGFDIAFYSESRGASRICRDAIVDARVSGHGRRFTANVLGLAGVFPVPDIRIRGAVLDLAWNGRALSGTRIAAATSVGRVTAPEAAVDFTRGAAEGALRVTGDRAFLRRLTGLPVAADPVAAVQLSGNLEHAAVTAALTVDDRTSAAVDARVSLTPVLDIQSRFSFRSTGPGAYLGLPPGTAEGHGTLRYERSPGAGTTLTGEVTCDRCRLPPLGPVRLSAAVDVRRGTGTATASVKTPATRARGAAHLRHGRVDRGEWRLDSRDLAPLADLLRARFPVPKIRGRLKSGGDCARDQAGTLSCHGNLDTDHVAVSAVRIARGRGTFSLSPLAEGMPFDGRLHIRLARVAEERVPRAEATVSGNADRISVDFSAGGSRRNHLDTRFRIIPDAAVTVRVAQLSARLGGLDARLQKPTAVTIDSERIGIDPVDLSIAGGRLSALGDLPLTPAGTADFTLSADGIELGHLRALSPEFPMTGVVDLTADLSGPLAAPEGAIRSTIDRLTYGKLPLGSGTINVDYRDRHLRAELKTQGGPARSASVTADARVALDLAHRRMALMESPRQLTVAVDGLDLAHVGTYIPRVAMSGTLDVAGSLTGTGAILKLHSTPITLFNRPLGAIALTAWMEDGQTGGILAITDGAMRRLRMNASLPLFVDDKARPVWRDGDPLSANVELLALDVEKLRALAAPLSLIPETISLPEAGVVGLQVDASGTAAAPILDVSLSSRGVSLEGTPVDDTTLSAHLADRVLHLDGKMTRAFAKRATLAARLPVSLTLRPLAASWRHDGAFDIRLTFDDLDSTSIAPFSSLPPSIHVSLNADLEASGTTHRFTLNGDYDGEIRRAPLAPVRVTGRIRAGPEEQRVVLDAEQLGESAFDLSLTARAPIRDIATGRADPLETPIVGSVAIPGFSLEMIAGLLPPAVFGLSGRLDGAVRAEGTIRSPRVHGTLALNRGGVTVVSIGQRLDDITARLRLEGRHLTLETLRFNSGTGRAKGTANLELGPRGALDGSGTLRLKRFPVIRPGLPEGILNAELDMTLRRREDDTDVGVSIANTDLMLLSRERDAAPKPIIRSRHVVLVDENREPLASDREDEAEAAPGRLQLTLRVPESLRVHGAGVEMSWDGALAMTWENGAFAIDGAIETDHGYFQLLGNNMWIEKGEITIPGDGDLDPLIYVLAHANTPEADVTMSLSGRMSRPRLQLSSTPPLTQYEIMTLLATGKSHSGRGADDSEVQTQITSMLLAVRNPLLQSELNRRLRLDYVSASIGDAIEDPVLVAGKRVNRNIYLQTQVAPNAGHDENRVTGRVEYRITPRWTVETYYGDANKGGVGLYWSKRFGLPEPKGSDASDAKTAPAPKTVPAENNVARANSRP